MVDVNNLQSGKNEQNELELNENKAVWQAKK